MASLRPSSFCPVDVLKARPIYTLRHFRYTSAAEGFQVVIRSPMSREDGRSRGYIDVEGHRINATATANASSAIYTNTLDAQVGRLYDFIARVLTWSHIVAFAGVLYGGHYVSIDVWKCELFIYVDSLCT